MRIIRVNTVPDDPDAVYIATDVFPDVEFRIDLTVHTTSEAIIDELKRRIKERKSSLKPKRSVIALTKEIKALIGKDI